MTWTSMFCMDMVVAHRMLHYWTVLWPLGNHRISQYARQHAPFTEWQTHDCNGSSVNVEDSIPFTLLTQNCIIAALFSELTCLVTFMTSSFKLHAKRGLFWTSLSHAKSPCNGEYQKLEMTCVGQSDNIMSCLWHILLRRYYYCIKLLTLVWCVCRVDSRQNQ